MTERTLQWGVENSVSGWVANRTKGLPSVLDLGAGYFNYTREAACPVRVGIDSFRPYVEKAKANEERSEGIKMICGDMRYYRVLTELRGGCVMLIDALEHLDKEDGLRLLGELFVDFDRVLVFVPVGKHEQEPCDDNEAQRHRSFWEEDEMRGLGFYVSVDHFFHRPWKPEAPAAMFCEWNRS